MVWWVWAVLKRRLVTNLTVPYEHIPPKTAVGMEKKAQGVMVYFSVGRPAEKNFNREKKTKREGGTCEDT